MNFQNKKQTNLEYEKLFSLFPKIDADEYILRELCPDDIDSVFSIYSDDANAKYVTHHIMKSKSEVDNYLDNAIKSFSEKTQIRWALAKKSDNTLIGILSLHSLDVWDKSAQIGYLLDRNFWRKGITSKCVNSLVNYIFNNTFIEIIEASIDPTNKPSIDFIKKVGFKKYRIRLGYHLNRTTGHYENRFFYRLTKDSYFIKQ